MIYKSDLASSSLGTEAAEDCTVYREPFELMPPLFPKQEKVVDKMYVYESKMVKTKPADVEADPLPFDFQQ